MKNITEIRPRLNKLFFLLLLICYTGITKSQSNELWLFANAGTTLSGSQYTAEYTLGEPITGYIETAYFSAQQGYHISTEEGSGNNNGTATEAIKAGLQSVYPVPFYDQVTITGLRGFEGNVSVKIKDLTGKIVYIQNLALTAGNLIIPGLSGLLSGYYTIHVTNPKQHKVFSVLKE